MGFRGHIAFEKGVGLAIKLNRLTAVKRGARNELVAGLQIGEDHFAVFGVNVIFHVSSYNDRVASGLFDKIV